MVSYLDDSSRFSRTRVAADALTATRTRVEFGSWLQRHFTLSAERFSDLLLAVNEALANAAEFAYADAPRGGTMDVNAAYDFDSDTLAVTVSDHGRWRVPELPTVGTSPYSIRGRGIPLMRALADEATIDATPHGTQVTLTWIHLMQSSRSTA
ncbi:ATP-binding protein [Mycobacterium riyadhense]|uniref:Anti-sigma regulatory factor n=1 Tax=Mycobacterium riyadhense TaxID=486698 RepID=A0A1X2CWR1_9MYCO|nr:ATP-binding protein [Mycobacterium riyadhense]MCV7145318.1 ATP-binding protein [Mycobacterium riyadhense]ORW80338.1 anti-sigma regulatory factor [Mycobacterium riyadhense]